MMCPEKVKYATRGAAIGAAVRASRKRGTALRFYRCPLCRKWHLTSQTKKGKP